MTAPTKSLILPCENRTRELDGKLLIACVAAERGFTSFIGAKLEINLEAVNLPRSIYLQKSLSKRSYRMFDILERLGHWIVDADEEGVVYYSPEHYYETRIHPATFAKARGLLAWGPDNEDLWSKHPDYPGAPIAVTGNARVDLLRPELRSYFDREVEEIRDRLGHFVLINSNFGGANHYFPAKSGYLHLANRARHDPELARTFEASMATHVVALYRAFVEMLPELAKAFPDRTFVLRPHPSESHESWQRATHDCPNVHIIHEGNVVPWLIAADGLIHNGCTTGLEARILGTPVISYEPIKSGPHDLHLPNEVSLRTTDLAGLIKRVGELESEHVQTTSVQQSPETQELIARYISAIDGPLASDRMCDAIEGWLENWQDEPLPNPWRRWIGIANGRIRALEKRIYQKMPEHNNSRSYVDHVFAELSLEDIEVRLSWFRRALGRFADVRARQHSRNVFELRTA